MFLLHIGRDGQRPAPCPFDQADRFFNLLPGAGRYGNTRTCCRERKRDTTTDSSASSGYQGDLAIQLFRHRSTSIKSFS